MHAITRDKAALALAAKFRVRTCGTATPALGSRACLRFAGKSTCPDRTRARFWAGREVARSLHKATMEDLIMPRKQRFKPSRKPAQPSPNKANQQDDRAEDQPQDLASVPGAQLAGARRDELPPEDSSQHKTTSDRPR